MSILGKCTYCLHTYTLVPLIHSRDAEPASGIFRFSDSVAQPDSYCSDYDLKIKGTGVAIVIDNGEK